MKKVKRQITTLADLRAEVHRYNFGHLSRKKSETTWQRISGAAKDLGVELVWKDIGSRQIVVIREESLE